MTNNNSVGFAPCALIPVYNHSLVLEKTCKALLDLNLHVILVDDGSDNPCKAIMQFIADRYEDVSLITRATNGGKGAAVKSGLRFAQQKGYSHSIQVDADGQHNLADVSEFISAASREPNALILGYPAYDTSVPKHRYYARYLTHIWIWINTLSFSIQDTMCGFRVYPVAASNVLINSSKIGDHMDFDSEFVVRWYWAGLEIVQRETKVIYPADGISHFRLLKDNALISGMHAKLFFGMLWRIPILLGRKIRARFP